MAVYVRGIVASTYVIAEDVHVELVGRGEQIHYLVNLLLVPVAHLSRPPAQGTAPALERLVACGGINGDGLCTGRGFMIVITRLNGHR